MKQDSGFGLPVEELQMDKVCPEFWGLYALYGECANVSPPSTTRIGLPGHPQIYIDHGEEDIHEV